MIHGHKPNPMKPHSEFSEINKTPILAVLKEIFADRKRVLEIASGTGQHAVYFGRELPYLIWQPGELALRANVILYSCRINSSPLCKRGRGGI